MDALEAIAAQETLQPAVPVGPDTIAADDELRAGFDRELTKCEGLLHEFWTLQQVWTREQAINWWRLHESRFPNVARVARRVLCVPATSVPSERAFSLAGHVNTKDCAASIGIDTVRAMVVGKSLWDTTKVMGLEWEDAEVAVSGMRCVQDCVLAVSRADGHVRNEMEEGVEEVSGEPKRGVIDFDAEQEPDMVRMPALRTNEGEGEGENDRWVW